MIYSLKVAENLIQLRVLSSLRGWVQNKQIRFVLPVRRAETIVHCTAT